ncbi:MAG: helix-turn-helix protein [Mucilaginibacter sp.]|nr:helix-turn-helix protein [Mucilaginibacter sp.]
MKDVGEKIRLQRLTKKYSQEYMAFMLDISQPAYSKIERDETELTIQRIFDIAEILEINPFTLLPKPKHGASIRLTYYHTLEKLRKFWKRAKEKKLAAKKEAYDQSQGH